MGCCEWMSPLQGSIFYTSLRRALPYAIECRPFRAETLFCAFFYREEHPYGMLLCEHALTPPF